MFVASNEHWMPNKNTIQDELMLLLLSAQAEIKWFTEAL